MSDEKRLPKAIITIDLDAWFAGYDEEDGVYGKQMYDAVVHKAADILLTKLNKAVDEKMSAQIVASVVKRIDAEVEVTVRARLDETIALTNGYGEKTGAKTTLRETIANRATAWLSEKVDSRGETRGYGDNNFPRLQWYIQTAATSAIDTALKAEIAAAVGEIKKQVAGKLSGMLGEALQKIIGIPV